MARLYNPKDIYDPATMPLVEGWAENNNCVLIRFHWVLTEADQKAVDTHWRPEFYRHSLINTKMALATHAGAGVPGWEELGSKIAQGRPVEPTGLDDDPRLPLREGPKADILQILQGAKDRYDAGVKAEHERMLTEHAAMKTGSWAQRAAVGRAPPPALEDSRRSYEQKVSGPKRPWPQPPAVPGVWHEWEIVEIAREQQRQDAVERAWQRAEDSYKAINPTWGGGT
jgi:hypothetical protein